MTKTWQAFVEAKTNETIVSLSSIGGGDFAQSFQAQFESGQTLFVKTHQNPPPYFFTTEAAGLEWLRSTGHVNVPAVVCVSDYPPCLAMEWVDLGYEKSDTDAKFGRQLARMHQAPFDCFGRPDGRTTGSQAVPNEVCTTWGDFYATQRLLPLAKLAHDKKALAVNVIEQIESVANRLDEFGASDETACLLHGDLWAGNRIVDANGDSWLIDPAAHGGHREFDLAMMQLFGGYGRTCFSAYDEVFPIEPGWQDRVALHQLAPLIVHAIKFGGSYRAATTQALAKYS